MGRIDRSRDTGAFLGQYRWRQDQACCAASTSWPGLPDGLARNCLKHLDQRGRRHFDPIRIDAAITADIAGILARSRHPSIYATHPARREHLASLTCPIHGRTSITFGASEAGLSLVPTGIPPAHRFRPHSAGWQPGAAGSSSSSKC
jgi:hypothetical protein